MKVPNSTHQIEQFYVKSTLSFYKNLKFVIKQADIVNKEIFSRENRSYNGIFSLEAFVSKKTVFCNANLIDFNNQDDYEIQLQEQVGNIDIQNPESDQTVVSIVYEHEQFTSVLEKQFIKWWEEDVKDRIVVKYGELKNANSMCQFARQIRNSFGHSQVNVTAHNCPDPIWNGLNLKKNNGKNIYTLLTVADLINFWIEFEESEL